MLGSAMQKKFLFAGLHFLSSAAVLLIIFLWVTTFWYPNIFFEKSGAYDLFKMIFFVDVILGPLLSFFIFKNSKKASETKKDLILIVCIQVSALAYGVNSIYAGRPLAIIFEGNVFTVVHANDIEGEMPDGLNKRLGMPVFAYSNISREMGERGPENRSQWHSRNWIDYESRGKNIIEGGLDLSGILKIRPDQKKYIINSIENSKLSKKVKFYPLVIKHNFLVVAIDGEHVEKMIALDFGI